MLMDRVVYRKYAHVTPRDGPGFERLGNIGGGSGRTRQAVSLVRYQWPTTIFRVQGRNSRAELL